MTSATEKRRKEFAERVARSLESGVVPWQRKDLPDMPAQSAVSGRSYGGLNALYLMEKCAEKGYKDPRFITASEANKNGLYVRKGEHGTVLEHWTRGNDGKIKPRGYVVFNTEQLNGKLPVPEPDKPNLEKAAQMLKNAGIEIKPGSDVKEYREAIKKLTVRNAEEHGVTQTVHTPELLGLRYSIASTAAMREAGIPVEQPEGAPVKSWANSIRHDPSQLSKAARDGGLIAEAVLMDMGKDRAAELFRAAMERADAQRGQELAAEAAAIPRGLDSNLPNADLSAVQEAVIAASDKAAAQVNDLRASASAREVKVNEPGNGIDKMAAARNVAKKELGDNAIVTSAQPGKTYSGKILGILGGLTAGPDMSAVQAISDNHAVLHEIKSISDRSNLKVGEEAVLSADEQGYSAVQGMDKGMDAETKHRKREGHKR
ncbi:MAG: ssDNA-binding domain-containing protein [Synergistaceae bacterium]|jgi:antirestriction protein ArdC|nr:ssDNA-binding domain-containing protein [Synergistaceae bacterium]